MKKYLNQKRSKIQVFQKTGKRSNSIQKKKKKTLKKRYQHDKIKKKI